MTLDGRPLRSRDLTDTAPPACPRLTHDDLSLA